MGNINEVVGNLEYLYGIWVVKDDSIGEPVVFRFCGSNNRQCFTMSYITTNIFGVPGKIYCQVQGKNFGFKGEYTLESDGIYVEIQDIEGDPLDPESVPPSSMVSLFQKGKVIVFEVNHATNNCVSASIRNVMAGKDGEKEPAPEAFPTFWEMQWNGDQPYLERPISKDKRAVAQRRVKRISVKREPDMKPGDKGRITLPDGREVEYTVPPGEESHFIVAF
ncbi:unnamed protein product [Amoebophrya sp. A120]|nr:unnamed protein product [Amoebophrya sp. A120]|eukprot:GSA120T00018433001.1